MPKPVDTRERIVRGAARLFLTRSYTGVGVADLCAAADVRRGSFYHYFPSKAELAKAVVDLHAAEFDRRMDQACREHGVRGRLRAAADAVFAIQSGFEDRFGRIVGCPFGNLAAELATTDDEVRAHVAAVFAGWEARLAEICREAAAEGALRAGVEPERAAHAVLAQMQGLILLAKVRGASARSIRDDLDTLIDSFLITAE
ncbi:TetR/AcrR family transcriptional regulator [Pseudonocardia acaciae]|uniref:TetR/AcrR family transcriptional regulator n=1 Tax=Pseudonocardia acaciae TaxID=551276 RepID=UPI00048BBA7B|nr:TetR/AcrR family transcriptional regulator [Pseudonocardia acaciae]